MFIASSQSIPAPVERIGIPDRPAPSLHPHPRKQGPHRYHGPVRQRAPRRYSVPSGVRLGTLPLATLEACAPRRRIDARLLTFRAGAADQAQAAFTPGTAWPVTGTPARLVTREQPDPSLSMPPRFVLTTPQQHTPAPRAPGPGASGTSSRSPPDAIMRAFSPSLTTTVFSQRSTGWFDALPRRTTPESQQASISSTAPPIKDVSYTTPPSAFVTHGCRENTWRSRWIACKGGFRKRPSRPSHAGDLSRGRLGRRL
jgi:hypothetical protein